MNQVFRHGQLLSSSALSFAHGTNDAQKTMGVITLALVYFVTRYALLVMIHQFGDQSQTAAGIIADLVLSPLVFVGTALLYVDQAARVE